MSSISGKNGSLKKIIIVGGGTAGWMAAAALSKQLGSLVDVTLIESPEIGTIGVGESTIPPLRVFHQLLGVREQDFMRATTATFKLGVSFEGWGHEKSHYIHSFGITGQESWVAGFQNLWLLARERGIGGDFGDYCFELAAARKNKFSLNAQSNFQYSYHLDASKYTEFLRQFCSQRGVTHVPGTVDHVRQNHSTGFIETVMLDDGSEHTADLFIDCTGFKGLLIEKTLNTGYEDWRHWLPCDRAVVAQSEATSPASPYTRAIAHDAGWRWRIPLQKRMGNGLVYSSRHMSDDAALKLFSDSIKEKLLHDPRIIQFTTGRRRKVWNKNCVALGLSAGFVEPLESTGIHLFMTGITRLLQLFPFGEICPSVVKEYNQQSQQEIENIRDFIVLHYYLNSRKNSDFWRFCQTMEIPEKLQTKIQLFQESARIFKEENDPFRVDSWAQVMIGQGLIPKDFHKVAMNIPSQELASYLKKLKSDIHRRVDSLPSHQEFINQYCAAN